MENFCLTFKETAKNFPKWLYQVTVPATIYEGYNFTFLSDIRFLNIIFKSVAFFIFLIIFKVQKLLI